MLKSNIFLLHKKKEYSQITQLYIKNSHYTCNELLVFTDAFYKTGKIFDSFNIISSFLLKHFLNKDYFSSFINLTYRSKNFYEATISLRNCIRSGGLKSYIAYLALARFYNVINKHLLSNKYYSKALRIKRDNQVVFEYAKNFYEINQRDKGQLLLEESLSNDPQNGEYHRYKSMFCKFKNLDDSYLKKMINIYQNFKGNNDKKSQLMFAIAKAYEDLGEYKNSANFYSEANKLTKQNFNFDISLINKQFSNLKELYMKNFHEKTSEGFEGFAPIFIIGLPRSGTTLVEQIISSHSDVAQGGEVTYFSKHFNYIFNEVSEGDFLKGLSNFNSDFCKIIGEKYFIEMKRYIKKNFFITDKMNFNFIYSGFIKKCLPKAKILHCYKNKNDIFFSLLKQYFPTTGVNFVYDPTDLKNYYKSYIDLMKFWKQEACIDFYDLSYDNLVDNTEIEIKKILDFCNLSFDPKCLEFYSNKNFVKTLSSSQVRSGISSSKNKWKNFEPYLQEYFNS